MIRLEMGRCPTIVSVSAVEESPIHSSKFVRPEKAIPLLRRFAPDGTGY
jgi:hypothetical protein